MDSDNDYFFHDADTENEKGDENEFDDSSTFSSEVIDKGKKKQGEHDDFASNMWNQDQAWPSEDEAEEEFVYEILETDKIVKHMSDCIREVNVILQLPSTFTRVLLNHFKWNKDKLVEKFYEDDQEKLFSDVKILLPFRSQITSANEPLTKSTNSSKSEVKKSANECEICFLPVSANEMIGVQCGHTFCASCWNRYLTTKIMDKGLVEIISCAGHGCNSLVDDETVMKFVKDKTVKLKYQHLITKSFVECNRLLHWCTEPNCSYVIKVQYFDAKPVTCKCSKVFCFDCGENWHDPVPCKWLKSWLNKCYGDNDIETYNWIAANTKQCPKCREATEKNGGCNHMTCSKCKFKYCWMCLGDLRKNHRCNKYMENFTNINLDVMAIPDRFLFYYNRYVDHMKSLTFDHQLYLSTGKKMEKMQQNNAFRIEVKFLKDAIDVLCRCRQTLMYAYVFAFYLEKNNQFIIFEDNQNDLEIATEELSEYLERALTLHELRNMKQEVQDMLRNCKSRRKVLIDYVHEGNDKDFWLFRNIDI